MDLYFFFFFIGSLNTVDIHPARRMSLRATQVDGCGILDQRSTCTVEARLLGDGVEENPGLHPPHKMDFCIFCWSFSEIF